MSAEPAPGGMLVLIDGHYYAYRYFFGMPPLTGPGGRPTGVTYAFAKLLSELRANPAITHLAAIFDDRAPSFRHQIYPEYKAHRDPTPDLLARQFPDIEDLIAATGVPLIKAPGYEADDALFTYARQAAARGMQVRLLTKDKDVDQALGPLISTWDPGKDLLRGPAELVAEKGIRPEQVVDYLVMIGDTSDNVPGIEGIGPKTAAKLLAEHGSLAGVVAAAATLTPKKRAAVEAFAAQEPLVRRLITLVDVPGLPAIDDLAVRREHQPDAEVYARFGFSPARFSTTVTKPASQGATYRTLARAELPAFLERLRARGRFAIDTETTGLDPRRDRLVGMSFACGEGDGREAAYLPFLGTGAATVPWEEARPLLAPLLGDPAVRKVGQNLKFDWQMLHAHGLEVRGYDGDTMLASWLLDPGRESHGIDYLARTLLGEDKIPTTAVVDFAAGQTMADVPVARVAEYACEDAQCTWRLAQLLEGRLAEHGLLEVYRGQEVPIAACLARMELAGLAVDRAVLDGTRRHLEAYLAEVQAGIRRHAGPDFNPASPKQVAQVLFERLKLPRQDDGKGQASTDHAVLERLRGLHELPDLLLQHRTLSKLIGAYLAKLPEHIDAASGRIHTHLRQTGTETGRLASEGPNLQAIPKKTELGREVRAAFAAPAGRVLIAADYSQIELRVLAEFSGDPALRRAFAENRDVHRFVAAQVAGCDEAAVTPQQRQAAKAVNFGIIYGQTAFGLSQQIGIPRGDAQRFIDGYFERFAGVQAYIARVVAEAAGRGWVQTLSGRRRYVPQLTSPNRNERLQGERIALNSTIQGSAADLIKRAMLRCERLLPAGSHLVLQIHDELIVEAGAGQAAAAAAGLVEAMRGAADFTVPLVAEARTGATWLEVS